MAQRDRQPVTSAEVTNGTEGLTSILSGYSGETERGGTRDDKASAQL